MPMVLEGSSRHTVTRPPARAGALVRLGRLASGLSETAPPARGRRDGLAVLSRPCAP